MDKQIRSIIEDLLPLYQEGLLSEATTQWFEEQVANSEELQQLVAQTTKPLEKVEIKSPVEHDKMIQKIKRRLSIYQLIFIGISFFLAINTSLLNESFGFILWYTVLGVLTYVFYKDIKIVIYISMLPIFIWSIGVNISDYLAGHIDGSITLLAYLLESIMASFFLAVVHFLFALIGSLMGLLIFKIKEKG